MKIFLLAYILMAPISLWAQDDEMSNIFEYTKKIHKRLKELKNLESKNYLKDVDSYREDLEKYFAQKKRVCEGEFSTVILGGSASTDKKEEPVKLKPEERKLCFRELKALQLTFVNNLFTARKRYLVHLHKKRLEELETAREKAVHSLQGSFDKKNRP